MSYDLSFVPPDLAAATGVQRGRRSGPTQRLAVREITPWLRDASYSTGRLTTGSRLAIIGLYSTGWLNTEGYGASLNSNELDKIFAALADPVRRQILARLAEGDATVNELAEPFDISLQAISKHIKVLERAGLITRGRDAQRRPCSLNADALAVATDWIYLYRRRKEQQFDRLDALLQDDRTEKEEPA